MPPRLLLDEDGDIVEPKEMEEEVTKRGSRRTIIRDATQMLSRLSPRLDLMVFYYHRHIYQQLSSSIHLTLKGFS